MFDDEEEDNGFFLLVLGVLAAILLIVTVVARSGDDLPTPTVTGDAPEEAEVTTTTEAPATTTTTTTEAPAETTTTAAPVEATTMWSSLNDSGAAGQFALIGGALGLQDDLEALEDADGNPVQRTLFAPSDAALTALGSGVADLAADPEAAATLVGYHFLEGVYTIEDLIALDGQTVETRIGLPLRISVVDGQVILNDVAALSQGDFAADNGIVHIVEAVLQPPTVNEVIGLENIEFATSSAVITAAGEAELQKAVAFFTENPDVNASIEGHTDTDGGDEGNLALSQARADSVLAFLAENGLDADRFTATGFGETQPILVDGVEDKDASRRIEFNVR